MFRKDKKIKLTPCFGSIDISFAMLLFACFDLIPILFNCWFFILLTLIEAHLYTNYKNDFRNPKYVNYCRIRIAFYLFCILFLLMLFYVDNLSRTTFWEDTVQVSLLAVKLVFIVWNIYLSMNLTNQISQF